ncbi:hypothetical protein [Streptomyces sp. NPDC006355]|uniref:hypothetical protein n=1 Tax=Streptomyces sp. NPDC006355 TaxID=3156758 RepID=UPI00339F386D
MREGEFKMNMHRGWENEVLSTLEAGALVAEVTGELRNMVVRDAPRAKNVNTNWNQIKKNVSAFVEKDIKGYYGNVTLELNDRVRHALLQDRGWTDRRGRRHPGKRYLREVLLKARIQ